MSVTLLRKIFRGGPWNLLADRSRDQSGGEALLRLEPQRAFRVTLARVPVAPRLFRKYDIIALCGSGAKAYSRVECAALERFVRRGGGLILAACPGPFEVGSGRPVADLAVNAVAARFGFRFCSVADLPPDIWGSPGYAREKLEMTAAGRAVTGLRLGEIPLGRVGRIETPPGATVLVREKAGGAPCFALARHGRGRVLVCADLALWNEWRTFAAVCLIRTVAPRPRRKLPAVPRLLDRPARVIRRGDIVLRCNPGTAARAPAILALAHRIQGALLPFFRKIARKHVWHLRLMTGLGAGGGRGSGPISRTHIGTDLAPAAMAGALTRTLGESLASRRFPWTMWRSQMPALTFALEIQLLEKFGYAGHAAQLKKACAERTRVDLGKHYFVERLPGQGLRLWLDLAEHCGPGALKRVFRIMFREKEPLKGLNFMHLSELDYAAWFWARAAGTKVYDWLEAQGHTVRRLPLEPFGSDKLKKALDHYFARLAEDPKQDADARRDAAAALAVRLADDKVPLDHCARQALGRGGRALGAALRLAQVKDERGFAALRRFLPGRDRGRAAVAALELVHALGDARAADTLVKLAESQPAGFQLAAGYALRLRHDARWKRFAFSRVRGCRMKVVHDSLVKAFPVVDGQAVANVWSVPQIFEFSYGAGFSTYYVQWVATSAAWRRRGLAREAMEASLAHGRWEKLASTTSLHTGVTNVAHALYRDFGLVDFEVFTEFKQVLAAYDGVVRPPQGIRLRRAAPRDAEAVSALLQRTYEARWYDFAPLEDWPGEQLAWVACQRREIVGVVSASFSGDGGNLEHFAVQEFKDEKDKAKPQKDKKEKKKPARDRREHLAQALLSTVHRALRARKVKHVETGSYRPHSDKFCFWNLRLAGYATSRSGMVELHRLNRLGQFLGEVRPVFECRLKASEKWKDWRGTVLLETAGQRAALVVSRGRVAVREGSVRRPSVTVRGDRGAMIRILLGVLTPFEAALQLEVKVGPLLNEETRGLLETLFPRLIVE